jgi:hypothetical protein
MRMGGGFIDDLLAVAEELHPTGRAELAHTGGAGTRWVTPISLDRHRAVIVRGTATEDSPLADAEFECATPKRPPKTPKIRVKAKLGEPKRRKVRFISFGKPHHGSGASVRMRLLPVGGKRYMLRRDCANSERTKPWR